MITLKREAWKRFAPKCPDLYTDVLFSSLTLLEEAGLLENELRGCHFAATVFEETGDFRETRESLLVEFQNPTFREMPRGAA